MKWNDVKLYYIAEFLKTDSEWTFSRWQWDYTAKAQKENLIQIPIELKTLFETAPIEANSIEIEINLTSSGYDNPGNVCGYPENCYPPESEDIRDIESCDITFYQDSCKNLRSEKLDKSFFSILEKFLEIEIYDI